MRRKLPPSDVAAHSLPLVTMPKADKQGDKFVPTEPYDPDKHFLFPDVLFGKWSFD